eukprot:2687564-Rhodomonas_salina.1
MEPCSEQEQGFRGVLLNLRIDSPAARALGVSGFICGAPPPRSLKHKQKRNGTRAVNSASSSFLILIPIPILFIILLILIIISSSSIAARARLTARSSRSAELQLVPLAVACCLSQDDALGFQKLRRAGDARDCLTFNHSFRLFRWLQSRSSERGHARTWQLPAPLAWQANGTNGGGARRSMDSNMRRTMDSNMGSERDLRMPRAMSLLPDRTR